jgi:hypothetical protein
MEIFINHRGRKICSLTVTLNKDPQNAMPNQHYRMNPEPFEYHSAALLLKHFSPHMLYTLYINTVSLFVKISPYVIDKPTKWNVLKLYTVVALCWFPNITVLTDWGSNLEDWDTLNTSPQLYQLSYKVSSRENEQSDRNQTPDHQNTL